MRANALFADYYPVAMNSLLSGDVDRRREKFNKLLWSTDLTCEDLGGLNYSC